MVSALCGKTGFGKGFALISMGYLQKQVRFVGKVSGKLKADYWLPKLCRQTGFVSAFSLENIGRNRCRK